MGGIKNEIDNQIDIDFANGQLSEDEKNQYHSDIANGIIPTRYRNMLDVHTLPIRDGNCSVPVGMHTYDLDDNGNMINSKLWYGAAAPAMWVQGAANYGKLLPIRRGTTNPNHNGVTGWDTGVWQIPEEKYMTSGINIRSKNAKAADLIDEFKSDILKSSGLTKLNADEAQLIGALGQYSASFGGCSSAQGKRAFAEGTNTVAIGKYSHAEGDNSVTLGNDSHAEGYGTVAFGNASHAEGSGAVSFGMASHAGGSVSTAAGDASFAHGTDTRAYGTHSSAFGNGTIATRDNSFVIGKFNIESDDLIFGVGCGYDNSNRQNALALYAEDQGRTGLHVYGERVATENQVSELTEELRTEVKNNYGRKSVSGEILEIKDLDNPFNATVTSTVTDNYFYKKNYINGEARYPGSTDYEQPFNEPSVKLITQDGAQSEATITRSKYRDGFTQRTTAYIIFKTPNNAGQYTKVKLTFEGGSAFEIVTTLKQPLKDLHQYMLIINYGQEYYDEGMGSHIVDMTLTHLVDYEDSYHWIIGQDTAGIPCPYTIMIPHVGRIDKGDTLSIAYQCSEAAAALNNLIDSGSTLPDANDPDAPKFFVLI